MTTKWSHFGGGKSSESGKGGDENRADGDKVMGISKLWIVKNCKLLGINSLQLVKI
jgi:hypothetical protein